MPVTRQELQKVIWDIQGKLPHGYVIKLSWPEPNKNAYITKDYVHISETEMCASKLYVDAAFRELTPEKLDKLYDELLASYERVKKNAFTPDENLSNKKAQQLLPLQ